MKLFHIFLIVLTLLSSSFIPVYADDEVFAVYDVDNTFKEEFDNYNEAYRYYQNHLDEYQNLILCRDDKVIHMEYGIVEFLSNEACDLNIDYYSTLKKEDDLINGCLGIDGAYLETSSNGSRVYFVLSGDRGYTSIDNVILRPYETLNTRISSYSNNDEHFIHNIKSQLAYDFYSYSIELDDKLTFLNNGDYYSYDGHYFYDDFYTMIDDYRQETYENSLNETPYYNYYQYLPHRSLTNYELTEIENYVYETLGINNKLNHYDDINNDSAADEINRSQLYGEIHSFFENESVYGVNALMLLSSGIYESSYGRSLSSYNSNNLYHQSAYDSEIESNNDRYDSVASSIYSHSKYFISSRYSNHLRSDYKGTFYGNKLSGINVNYSIDPYYGEKSASTYYQIDSALGYKDKNSYAVGIVNNSSLNLYIDENLDTRRYTLNNIEELSFVILEENDESYKINVDNSFNNDYRYDFEKSSFYVSKEAFSYILNEDKIHDYDLKEIHFDFNGGTYNDYSSIDIKTNKENITIKPYKSHYEFIGYDENNVAKYKYIEAIDLISSFNDTVELYQNIDLTSGVIRVFYDDKTFKDINITSDMISYFDNTKEGNQTINITYNGVSIEKQITVSKGLYELRNDVAKAIDKNDYYLIKDSLNKINYHFSFSDIRKIDLGLKEINKRNYVIDDKTDRYDISLSGLDLAIKDLKGLDIFGNTYYVVIKNIPYTSENTIYNHAKGYGFDIVEGMYLTFKFNFEEVELSSPIIVQVNLKDKRNDLVYSVYHLSKNGDIIKMRTTQSENYIQYMANESGSYLVLSRESANEYNIHDGVEDLSYENMGFDSHRTNFSLFLVVVVSLLGIIGIVVYYLMENRNKELWKDFKKSLRTQESVLEEKPKN